jgi:predicted phosphohydrolase
MRITFISDTHTKHHELDGFLPGGDLLLHAGDFSGHGYRHELKEFAEWFSKQYKYDHKIFIAGNHDRAIQDHPEECKEILSQYENVTYLQDDLHLLREEWESYEDMIKVWGSPWQPEFYSWAFNLPRGGDELNSKWDMIPINTDILITHGPPQGHLDTSGPPWNNPDLGCERLRERVDEIKPKIHVFGHIHGGYGYKFDGHTHFINAAILDERYSFTHKPLTIDWDPVTNKIEFI